MLAIGGGSAEMKHLTSVKAIVGTMETMKDQLDLGLHFPIALDWVVEVPTCGFVNYESNLHGTRFEQEFLQELRIQGENVAVSSTCSRTL